MVNLLVSGTFAFIIDNKKTLLYNFKKGLYTYVSTSIFSNIIFTNSEIPEGLELFIKEYIKFRKDSYFYEQLLKLEKKRKGDYPLNVEISKKELRYLIKIRSIYKILNLSFEQLFTLPSSVIERCKITEYDSILLLGDDDLHSVYVSKFTDAKITLIEIDSILIRFLRKILNKDRIILINKDIREIPRLKNQSEYGITLPPASKNGWHLFVGFLLSNCEKVLAPLPTKFSIEYDINVLNKFKNIIIYFQLFDIKDKIVIPSIKIDKSAEDGILIKKKENINLSKYLINIYEEPFRDNLSKSARKAISEV